MNMGSSDKISRRGFLKILGGAAVAIAAGGGFMFNWLRGNQENQGGSIENYVAACGFDCSKCRHYKGKCDGCLSTSGRLAEYVTETCEIRPCVLERGLENCAYCSDYGCKKLKVIHDDYYDAKAALDEIRRQSSSQ